jgi:hypothetical protein
MIAQIPEIPCVLGSRTLHEYDDDDDKPSTIKCKIRKLSDHYKVVYKLSKEAEIFDLR